MLQTQDNLLFAIPKKGRLHDKIIKLLEGAGLSYYRVRTRLCRLCWSGR
jgi:ATP phosphoribosyltransferase